MVRDLKKVNFHLFFYIMSFILKMDILKMSNFRFFDFRLKKIKNHFLKYFIFIMQNGHKIKICYFWAFFFKFFFNIYYFIIIRENYYL